MIKNIKSFHKWLDRQLNVDIPEDIIAFNVNIYESPFKIEIVGSSEFDPDDEDWACNEDWVPKKREISVSDSLFGSSWEDAQENIKSMAKSYIESNMKNVHKVKSAKAFAVGFVDGNLDYVQ